jgi:hypothetical protein
VSAIDASKNWDHQNRAKHETAQARAEGCKSSLVVAPCGAGKSRIMMQLTHEEVARGGSVRIYVHRTMLREQLSRDFTAAGISHGLMAAGAEVDESKPVQICMADSVYSRAIVRSKWSLGSPSLVMVDESHNQTGNTLRSILFGGTNAGGFTWQGHIQTGADCIGFTATPVNCEKIYDRIIECGSYSEMRRVGAHSMVRVYSPSEIDCAGLARNADYEFSSSALSDRAVRIFGNCYDSWKKLNPDCYPSLLYAPSVQSSRWFAEEWAKKGVMVAHIDGETCMLPVRKNGEVHLETYESDEEARKQLLEGSKSGEIALICNRFVLREAIDMPWIRHGIAATVFGGISSYLQSVGRIQRFSPAYPYKVWQCHGGSFFRHGSPNADRDWELGCTNKSCAQGRAEKIAKSENPQDVEGICCPKCSVWRQYGPRCPGCGHSHKLSVRVVQQVSGELKLMRGVVNKVKSKAKAKTPDKIWTSVLWGSAKRDRSVSSAVALYRARCAKEGVYCDITKLRFAPPAPNSSDWHLSVRTVYPWLGGAG